MAVSTNLGLYLPTREDYISVKRDLSDNYEVIDEHAGMMENGSAIVINGDTAPKAITSGQYLLIKNHTTLASGSYHAITNIANGATIDNSNVAIDTNGFANALNSKIVTSGLSTGSNSLTSPSDTYMIYSGYITGSGNYIDVFIPCDTSRITSVTSVKLGSYATLFTPTTIVDISGSTATEYAKTSLGIYAEFATGSTLTSDKNRVASLKTTSVTIVCA